MISERMNTLLTVGDRLCLWLVTLALLAAFIWHDREAELHSPILLPPCAEAKK